MFSSGRSSINLEDILSKVSESQILAFYLGIYNIPVVINSPLRKDKKPSFGLYSLDGSKIHYKDLATNDRGGLFDLLSQLWNLPFDKVLEKIYNDMSLFGNPIHYKAYTPCNIKTESTYNSETDLQCRIREWRDYDLEYWNSFGITKKWLEFAEIYPISHKIVIKDNHRYVFGADKYAYAFVEHKEGKVTLKLYQPYNTNGYKWSNKHDSSVIGLWTKVPKEGNIICMCSSMKDSLCLWANTGIPALSIQGEGYGMSETAINELKRRFKNIFILYDNDSPGLIDGEKLAKKTGFTNIVLPSFKEGKDISDYYKSLQDKTKFKQTIISLFKDKIINI